VPLCKNVARRVAKFWVPLCKNVARRVARHFAKVLGAVLRTTLQKFWKSFRFLKNIFQNLKLLKNPKTFAKKRATWPLC
jgi:hypothetical protein